MIFMPDWERKPYITRMEELHEKMKRKHNRKKPPSKLPEPKSLKEEDDLDLYKRGKISHGSLHASDQGILEEQA